MVISQTPFRMSFLAGERIWKIILESMEGQFCQQHSINIVTLLLDICRDF